jgi:hypothetical protein
VPGLVPTIDAMRLELLAPPPIASANWADFRMALQRPDIMAGATDEELRAVLLELCSELLYVGNSDRIEVRLRDRPGNNPK